MEEAGFTPPPVSGELVIDHPFRQEERPLGDDNPSLERSGLQRYLESSYSPMAQALTAGSTRRTAAGLRRVQNSDVTVSQALKEANMSPAQELVTAYMYYMRELEQAPAPARPALMARAEKLAIQLYNMQVNAPDSELARPLLHFYSRKSQYDAEARVDVTGTLEARLPVDETQAHATHVRLVDPDKVDKPTPHGGY